MKFNKALKKKLLKKLKSYMHEDIEALQNQDDGLSRVLKKLKKKEKHLQQLIDKEGDADEREVLQQELNVVHSQRKKGITLLSSIRKNDSA